MSQETLRVIQDLEEKITEKSNLEYLEILKKGQRKEKKRWFKLINKFY